MAKLLILSGFLLALHAAYAISKMRNSLYGEHNNIDFLKFPVEILVELIVSFFLVAFGVIRRYCNFEDIYIDKQNVEKRMKFVPKLTHSNVSSKGGMISYFQRDFGSSKI